MKVYVLDEKTEEIAGTLGFSIKGLCVYSGKTWNVIPETKQVGRWLVKKRRQGEEETIRRAFHYLIWGVMAFAAGLEDLNKNGNKPQTT